MRGLMRLVVWGCREVSAGDVADREGRTEGVWGVMRAQFGMPRLVMAVFGLWSVLNFFLVTPFCGISLDFAHRWRDP